MILTKIPKVLLFTYFEFLCSGESIEAAGDLDLNGSVISGESMEAASDLDLNGSVISGAQKVKVGNITFTLPRKYLLLSKSAIPVTLPFYT